MAYEGWVSRGDCVACPHCGDSIPVPGGEIPDILRAIDAHSCAAGHVQARAGLAAATGGASDAGS